MTDQEELRQLRALAVTPGWEQVWASADPRAAVQATGWTRGAGRRTYAAAQDDVGG